MSGSKVPKHAREQESFKGRKGREEVIQLAGVVENIPRSWVGSLYQLSLGHGWLPVGSLSTRTPEEKSGELCFIRDAGVAVITGRAWFGLGAFQ